MHRSRLDARELRWESKAADPIALCKELGIDRPFKRQPGGLIVCCPAHNEKDPSCSVSRGADGTLRVKCFSCGFSADAVGLVQKVHGLDFQEALRELARMCGRWDMLDDSLPRRPAPPRPPPPEPELPALPDERFHEIASALLERCPLMADEETRTYVESRGVLVDACNAGCAALPAIRGGLLAELRASFGDEDLERAGLFKKGRFMFPMHRLIIPWRNRDGRIQTIQRRRLTGEEPKYVFASGRQATEPFGSERFDETMAAFGGDAEVIVCEGTLDALARRRFVRQDGECAVVLAVPSVSTVLGPAVAELVKGRNVVLSFDRDEPGDMGAAALDSFIHDVARSVVRERPVGAKDVGDLIKQVST